MNIAIITTSRFQIKENTKTVWQEIPTELNEDLILTEEQVQSNLVDSMQFFKNLGGIERLDRGYTVAGYLPVKLTATSPCRKEKSVRSIVWKSLSHVYLRTKMLFVCKKAKLVYGFRDSQGVNVIYRAPKKATKRQLQGV